jgi:cytochrome P450
MIAARRRAGDAAERDDLLSMLLTAVDEEDADAAMTADQVYDEAITLFIAGHETTAIALSWSLYLLSQHPEAEAALLAEVGSVLGDRTPTVVDVPALKFTEWVAKEAMRLYPPAWVMGRITIEDVTLGGARIGKGSGVLMSPWVTHHDPRWYSDPLAFHPDRWGPDESGVELDKRIPRYAYFPFGGGPRVCIGQPFAMMELSLVLPQIVRAARLDLLPDQRIEPWPLVTLRPRHGIQMQVSRRETPAHRASRLPAQEIAV